MVWRNRNRNASPKYSIAIFTINEIVLLRTNPSNEMEQNNVKFYLHEAKFQARRDA